MHMRCSGFYSITSLHVFRWFRWWKNIENRSIYGKVMGKTRMSCFFWLTGTDQIFM